LRRSAGIGGFFLLQSMLKDEKIGQSLRKSNSPEVSIRVFILISPGLADRRKARRGWGSR
jgi:hypothetical protein